MRVNASGCVSDEARLNRSHVRTCADAAIARTMKKAVSLGLQLANENKRVSRRLASLRKAKMKTRKVSDDETDQANQE